jgi:hypothetical protein
LRDCFHVGISDRCQDQFGRFRSKMDSAFGETVKDLDQHHLGGNNSVPPKPLGHSYGFGM